MKHVLKLVFLIILSNIPFLLFSQTTGERKKREEIKFVADFDKEFLDSLANNARAYDVFYFLNSIEFSSKNKDYSSLTDYFQQIGEIDVILFFNGAYNRNNHCFIDMRSLEEVSYLEEGRSLGIIWIEDNPEDVYQTDVQVFKHETGVIKDANIIAGIFSDIYQTRNGSTSRGFGLTPSQNMKKFYIEGEFLETPIPSEIFVKIKQIAKTKNTDSLFKFGNFDDIISITSDEVYFYKLHEIRIRNYKQNSIGLSIGASLISLKPSLIKIDNNDLISVEKNNKAELKGKAHLLCYLQYPRSKIWDPGVEFWKSSFYDQFYKRFSIQAGIGISDRPLDNLFLGIGFSIFKHIDIILGSAFINDLKETNTDLSIDSFDDLDLLLPKKYTSNFFIGISFRASAFE